jgi:hypothetical protein
MQHLSFQVVALVPPACFICLDMIHSPPPSHRQIAPRSLCMRFRHGHIQHSRFLLPSDFPAALYPARGRHEEEEVGGMTTKFEAGRWLDIGYCRHWIHIACLISLEKGKRKSSRPRKLSHWNSYHASETTEAESSEEGWGRNRQGEHAETSSTSVDVYRVAADTIYMDRMNRLTDLWCGEQGW